MAATIDIEPGLKPITQAQSLIGWHREFCIELLGDAPARVFVRAVERGSLKAAELQRAVLFHRLDSRFSDLTGCVSAIQVDFETLIETARRIQPSKDNLFTTLEYDRRAWERVEQGLDRWVRQ